MATALVDNQPIAAKIVCHRCYRLLDVADNFCRHCGTPTGHLAGSPLGTPALIAQPPKWSESPWVVLPMLFLVVGPLALPMLWRSRQFTMVWKIALSAIMLVVTAVLIWKICTVMSHVMDPLRELGIHGL